MKMNKLERIVSYTHATQTGDNQWQGKCPAHDDKTASLSIKHDHNGNIGLFCHAGCRAVDVLNAMKMTWKDLFDDEEEVIVETSKGARETSKIVNTYDYTDYEGNLVMQTVRYEPKNFRQRRPDPQREGDWIWNLRGVENELFIYNIINVRNQIDNGGIVILVEGEKDADNLNSLGFVATTAPAGAKKRFTDKMRDRWERFSTQLKGADLIIIPDNDDIGKSYTDNIIQSLKNTCLDIRVLNIPDLDPKEDVSDWIIKGGTKQSLDVLIQHTAEKPAQHHDWIQIGKGGAARIDVSNGAKFMIDKFNGELVYVHDEFFKYDGKKWSKTSTLQIANSIMEELGKYSKKSTVLDILFHIQGILSVKNSDIKFDSDHDHINMNNGVLSLKDYKLYPHDKDFLFTIILPIDYKPDAKCNRWLRYINDLRFSQETEMRLQEWAGYVFNRSVNVQKCLYLKGDGANGKSIFLETLKKIWGNTSSLEMTEMFDKFKVSYLEGKLANICTDAETSAVLDARFKKIVAGEELVVERKNKDPFSFTPFAKIIFSCNDFIPTKDRSQGFFRRFDIIEFKREFAEHEQDPKLLSTLQTELEGIFIWALEGLRRLISNDWVFTKSEEFNTTTNDFIESVQPLTLFFEEEIEEDFDSGIITREFREYYLNWCSKNGYSRMSAQRINRELTRYGITKSKRKIKMQAEWVYEGIRLKNSQAKILKFS